MRLFQNIGLSSTYTKRLNQIATNCKSYESRLAVALGDRYGASHLLAPVLNRSSDAFFSIGNDFRLQRMWAQENGLKTSASLDEILLAQVEFHRPDVFYNVDPMGFGNEFVRRLPSCVKRTVAWQSSPAGSTDFGAYDLIVCNFPTLIDGHRRRGWRSEYFFPAHDPVMDLYAANNDRPIDVLFIGGFSRHHTRRTAALEAVAGLRNRYKLQFNLDFSRLVRIANSPVGLIGPFRKYRPPTNLRTIAGGAIFGIQMYEAMSRAKIVLNGAGDIGGTDRGNMRCFEALGLGSLLLTDEGDYPLGMEAEKTISVYRKEVGVVESIESLLLDSSRLDSIRRAGYEMIRSRYGKSEQFRAFAELCS